MCYTLQIMNDKRPLIVTGLVLFLIIALIGFVIFYLVNFIRGRQSNEQATRDIFPRSSMNVVVVSPAASPASTPSATQVTQQPATGLNSDGTSKTITGNGFQLMIPGNWGVLSCNNSKNLEFSPNDGSDTTVNCTRAVKPVTVLVGINSCAGGQVITLGNVQVRKIVDNNFKTRDGKGTQYHWCTQTSPSLDITHRVGSGTAFSADDFSAAVEQVITTLSVGGGS